MGSKNIEGFSVGNYRHPGVNPTVDMFLLREANAATPELLLIQRSAEAHAEAGKWALPGGFHDTNAQRGDEWMPSTETAQQAVIREVAEETGLNITTYSEQLQHVGDYEGGGRDPRDTTESWSRAQLFALVIPKNEDEQGVIGLDDATEARWFALDELPSALAFDHAVMIADSLTVLGRK